MDGRQQRRVAAPARHVDRGAGVQQHPRNRQVPVAAGEEQRRLAVLVRNVRVRPRLQQGLDDAGGVAQRGPGQRRRAVGARHVHVGPAGDERRDRACVPTLDRLDQPRLRCRRRPSVLGGRRGDRDERRDRGRGPGLHRFDERRLRPGDRPGARGGCRNDGAEPRHEPERERQPRTRQERLPHGLPRTCLPHGIECYTPETSERTTNLLRPRDDLGALLPCHRPDRRGAGRRPGRGARPPNGCGTLSAATVSRATTTGR